MLLFIVLLYPFCETGIILVLLCFLHVRHQLLCVSICNMCWQLITSVVDIPSVAHMWCYKWECHCFYYIWFICQKEDKPLWIYRVYGRHYFFLFFCGHYSYTWTVNMINISTFIGRGGARVGVQWGNATATGSEKCKQ